MSTFRLWRCLALVLILAVSLAPHATQAKGQIQKIVLSGPSLTREVEITDPAFLDAWGSLLGLETNVNHDQDMQPLSQVPHVGNGYTLVRYMQEPDGNFHIWDSLRYYPGPVGNTGYTFYIGFDPDSGSSIYDGKWFQVTPRGDQMMQQTLAQHGVAKAGTIVLPATGRTPLAPLWFVVLGGMLLAIGSRLRFRSIRF